MKIISLKKNKVESTVKKRPSANDQPGLVSGAVRMKLMGMAPAGSPTVTRVTLVIRKALREPEPCLIYSNLSSSETETHKVKEIRREDVSLHSPCCLVHHSAQARRHHRSDSESSSVTVAGDRSGRRVRERRGVLLAPWPTLSEPGVSVLTSPNEAHFLCLDYGTGTLWG